MKQFFKFFFASLLAQFLGGLVLIFILVGMVGAAISDSLGGAGDKPVTVKDGTVLHVRFADAIVDRAPVDGFDLQAIMNQSSSMGLNTILENLTTAAEDPRIEGIFLDFGGLSSGMASVHEIRNALIKFKESGKWMIAYSEGYSQGGYYLASVADEVYLYPQGGLDWRGLGGTLTFLKGFFDKTGVQMQVIRGSNNRFKSAVEPFLTDHMSEANREQTIGYLGATWDEMVSAIAASRGLDEDGLNLLADTVGLRTTMDAVDAGLIDELKYRDEILDLIRTKLSIEALDDIPTVAMSDYDRANKWTDEDGEEESDEPSFFNKEKVAVIYAIGSIESGEGDDATIGSDRIARAIRKARQDSSIKAIVFRINSPGGSALASDVIWRETILAKEAKPFIVSMGDLAASGGYYIACAADKIYASPTTLTGSIGVFGTLPYVGAAMEQHLGVTVDSVATNKYANLGSLYYPLSDKEYSIIQGSVDEIYGVFKQKVADGRGMTVAEVDSIGQGRVWAGADAINIGLVDEFGGLEDAIAYARDQAGIAADAYRLVELPEQKDPIEELLKGMSSSEGVNITREVFGGNEELYQQFVQMQSLLKAQGIQARLPFTLQVH